VSVWDKQAEVVEKYLKKGRQVMVKGRVEARAFTDRDGNVRASLELTSNTVKFLGGNPNANGDATSAPVISSEGNPDIPF
jgi:single-strand DNA-binding protein